MQIDPGRTFVIGDIHGCLDMLGRLVEKIPRQPDRDRLIFIGDYIDREPTPRGWWTTYSPSGIALPILNRHIRYPPEL